MKHLPTKSKCFFIENSVQMNTLIPKFIISIIGSIIFAVIFFNKEKIKQITLNHETKYFYLAILFTRIIPVFVIFLFLDYDATSDVKMFFDWAQAAKTGHLVYRDFRAPYAPLFSYITAIPLFIHNHVNSVLLLMVLIEAVILSFTFHFIQKKITKQQSLLAALLYLTLPATFILSVIGGQEDIWMWGVILVSLIVFENTKNSFWVGVVLGFGMIITKVIFVFCLPIALILLPNKIKYILGLAVIGLPSLAILVYFGGDTFLLPIQEANNPRTPNIWSIINPFIDFYNIIGIKNLNLIGLITNILIISYFSIKAKIKEIPFQKAFPLLWILSNLWLMFIQQSSLSNYCYIFLMPLIFYYYPAKNQINIWLILLFSFACAIQPPIWWGQKMPLYTSWQALTKPINALEYGLEIFIVGCIIYFCINILKTLFGNESPNVAA